MLGDIPMNDPSRADIEYDEHVHDAEADRDRGEEVAPEDRVGVIPHKGRPTLGGPTPAGRP